MNDMDKIAAEIDLSNVKRENAEGSAASKNLDQSDNEQPRLVIVTGMSGSGKTQAVYQFVIRNS